MNDTISSLGSVERFVTGHDLAGRAICIRSDVIAPINPVQGMFARTIWCSEEPPVQNAVGDAETIEDMGARGVREPPKNGTRFAMLDIAPGNQNYMHRTSTLDYIIVASGKIDLDMDDTTLHLKAGDVIVQRGTNHAWVNRSDEPARICVVMVDASPLDFL